jgi:hypothetical protein
VKTLTFVALGAAAAMLAWASGARALTVVIPLQGSITTPTVTLNGLDQTTTATSTLTVVDTGDDGWALTAWAPQPSGSNGSLGSLSVQSQPSTSGCTGQGCIRPHPTDISWPVTLGTSSGGAAKIYNAADDSGFGTSFVSVDFSVAVPANARAGTYSTTITLAVSSGP